MRGKPDKIQSLWIGSSLSQMESLCIKSFQYHGHPFHLYVYQQPEGLPSDVILEDAETILPHESIFTYSDRNTVSGFANLFRYKLLLEKGGIWVDTDMVCLRPFEFSQPLVFASQNNDGATSCMIKTPAGAEIMRQCYEFAKQRDSSTICWGETGPKLLDQMIRKLGLDACVLAHTAFCPIDYAAFAVFTTADTEHLLDTQLKNSWGVHLWNELWRLKNIDKNQAYPATSLYEKLKRVYSVNPL